MLLRVDEKKDLWLPASCLYLVYLLYSEYYQIHCEINFFFVTCKFPPLQSMRPRWKGQKYLDLKFEIDRCGNIWLEINRLGKLRKIQVATFDKSMWQAEKFEGDESAAASFATKLPRSPAFSLGLIQASVKHLDFTDNAATRCMWKQVKHLDSDDSGD